MGKISLNAPVRYEGRATTIAKLAEQGLIEFKEAKNFVGRRGSTRTRYFADVKGTTSGWEIGKVAFLSRTKKPLPFT